MRITSGRHKGKSLELIVLKDPEFIWDLLSSEAKDEKQRRFRTEASRLVATFNRRAFCVRCVGRDCARLATRFTIYMSEVHAPWWWCDTCDPWQYGAGRDLIRIVRTYQDALDFSETFGDPIVAQDIILTMAEAKGLLGMKESQVDIFFNG